VIFPCPNVVSCPDDSSPTYGLSSEAPDGPTFLATRFGSAQQQPRLSSRWINAQGFDYTSSLIDQVSADDAAEVGQITDQVQRNTPDGGCWNGVELFWNQPQSAQYTCPDGLVFTYTVEPGRFAWTDQQTANLMAQARANSLALSDHICLSSLNGFAAYNQESVFTVTASGGVGTLEWGVVSGSLPPGMSLLVAQGATASIAGVPSTPGNYTFSLQVVDEEGAFMVKTFTAFVNDFFWPLQWTLNPSLGVANVQMANNQAGFTALSVSFNNPELTGTMVYSSSAGYQALITVNFSGVSGALKQASVALWTGTPTDLQSELFERTFETPPSAQQQFTVTLPAGTNQPITIFIGAFIELGGTVSVQATFL